MGRSVACSVPESFVRESPTLTRLFIYFLYVYMERGSDMFLKGYPLEAKAAPKNCN